MKRLQEVYKMNSTVERLWPEPGHNEAEHTQHATKTTAADQQIAELMASRGELKQSLEKSQRRINRLIGEKNQLSSLLEKRDTKIEDLNRELGKYQAERELAKARHPGVPQDFSRPLVRSLGAASERIRHFVSKWSGAAKGDEAHSPAVKTHELRYTPLVACLGDGVDKPIVGVLLFGLEKDDIERLLPIIERDCTSRGMRPLILTDNDAFEVFRARGMPFEYLPTEDERGRFDASLNWDLYVQRRLAIVRKKWDPVRLIAFGALASETLKLWSGSPFEEAPLPLVASESRPA